MAEEKELSDVMVIKKFLLPDAKAREAMEELKALTDEDKAQLANGIRDGSFTY